MGNGQWAIGYGQWAMGHLASRLDYDFDFDPGIQQPVSHIPISYEL